MDAVSYAHSAKQAQRIEKFIENPDSTSGVLTQPSVIQTGETVTVPTGRTAILANTQIDGTLTVDGAVFIPSGATLDGVVEKVVSTDNALVRFNGTAGDVQNSSVFIDDAGNLTATGDIKSNTALKLRTSGIEILTIRDNLSSIAFETPDVSTDRGYSFRTAGDTAVNAFSITAAGSTSSKGSCNAGIDILTNTYTGSEGTGYTGYSSSNSYSQLVSRTTFAGSLPTLTIVTNSVVRARIMDNGTYQSATNVYGSTSDIKLKENIVDTTPKLEKLMQVQVRNFNYKGAEEKQIGVIAQEIEQIFPGVVYETEDEELTEVIKTREITLGDGTVTTEEYLTEEMQSNGEVTKNVKYSVIYMMMLKGMQELNDKVDSQKQEIDELRKMISDMKGGN